MLILVWPCLKVINVNIQSTVGVYSLDWVGNGFRNAWFRLSLQIKHRTQIGQ